MAFNLKEKTPLLSLNSIMELARDVGTKDYDPDNTLWYIEKDSQLAIMIHPAYGMMLYNDEMRVMAWSSVHSTLASEVVSLLDDYGLERDSEVWLEIGIDQVDYTPV